MEDLYRRIVGEVFNIVYDEDKGWMWMEESVKALEEYREEEEKRWQERARARREREEKERKKKKEKEEEALVGFRALFKPKD